MPYVDGQGLTYKYGEFYPMEFSVFAVNETAAQEYFPMDKATALKQKLSWRDEPTRSYKITMATDQLPDRAIDAGEDLTKAIIACAHGGTCAQQCTTAFRILVEDLELYKRASLPLPKLCPNCRHYERQAKRNPLKLWPRSCQHEGCKNTFETSYAPDRPEKVYCIECYQQEVA